MEGLLATNGGEGLNERGEGSEQIHEGTEHTEDPFKRSPTAKERNAPDKYKDPSLNQALGMALFSETEPLSSSVSVLKGTASFLEHRSPSQNIFQSNLHDQRPDLPASDLSMFSVCSTLPPPACAERTFAKFTGIFSAALEDRSKLAQEIVGELPGSGETTSKGRGRGRGRGRSEQNQDASSLLDHSNKRGSSNKRGPLIRDQSAGGRGKGRASLREKALLDQAQGGFLHPAAPIATARSLDNTIGGLSSFEHHQPPDFCNSREVPEKLHVGKTGTSEIPQYTRAPNLRGLDIPAVCGLLLPAQCTVTGLCETSPFQVEEESRQGILGHQFLRINEVTKGLSSSRGRGGRERGRGRGGRGRARSGSGDDQKVSPASKDASKTLKGKGRVRQVKGKRSLHREAISNDESSASPPSKGTQTDRMELSFPKLNSAQGVTSIQKCHEDVHSLEVRSSSIHLEDDSLCPPSCLAPRDSHVEEQCRLDYHGPAVSPSSIKGGILHQEMADFLMSSGVDSVQGCQASKSARKRTKSRKVLENENLWRELTAAHQLRAAPEAVGSTMDDVEKAVGSTSEHSQAQSTLSGENLDGISNKKGILQFNEKEFTAATGNASTAEIGVDENIKSAKKRKGQPGLKERARLRWPSPQAVGDVFRCLDQASDIDLQARLEHESYSRFSPEGDRARSEAEFSDFDSIEVVEDWQSYCPYSPFSSSLINVYEDGGPILTSLPIFGSARVSACTTKTWPDYYDLVLNAGGSVWALDWCPHRTHPDNSKREFLAVGAHPHDLTTHRLGEPVQGKNLIQLWAFDFPFLSQAQASWQYHHLNREGHGRQKAIFTGRARGRPKKLILEDEESREFLVGDVKSPFNLARSPHLLLEEGKLSTKAGMNVDCEKLESSAPGLTSSIAVEKFDLPQMVMGIAHDAGLVWDAKWQPINAISSSGSGRLGYLAAVFGNGSIQVYDIPLPSLLRKVKSYCNNTSPFIVKIKPVFKCSGLSSSGQKSFPLTIEWSSSLPHDLLLVGCHDGAVALWTFNPNDSRGHEARPLTCFVADTAPIRALAFAPDGTDVESRHVAVTGGHSGRLLFWDLRDPFYPLWDLALSKGGCILSIDWPLHPRGIILSMDDGTIRTLSLDAALSDAPLTGTPPPKSLSQGMHSTFTSDYAVWSVHVSRVAGIALYAGEDGSVVHCQLSEKYFVNDRARAREPHFLCCKLREDSASGVLSLESVYSNVPLQVKNQRADSKQVPLTKAFSRRASGGMYEEEEGQKKKSDRHPAKKRKLSTLEGRETDDEDFSLDEVDHLALVPYDPNVRVKAKGKSRSLSSRVAKKNSQSCKAPKDGMLCESSGTNAGAMRNEGESIEQPPSKAVALHRVRWNLNKGCESLVCFGGAAGIIRCQLIMPKGVASLCSHSLHPPPIYSRCTSS